MKRRLVVVPQEDRLLLFYSDGRRIRSKVIRENEVLEGKHYTALPAGHQGDKVKRIWESDFEHLVGDYYLAWGYQKVKNPDLGGKREVVYLSTFVFGADPPEQGSF